MDANVTFCQSVDDSYALGMKLMGEFIQNCGTANFNGAIYNCAYSIQVVKQPEGNSVQANKNVVSQFA